MNLRKLKELLHRHNQPPLRLGQIQKAVFRDGVSSWTEIMTLSKDLREKLEKKIKILSFRVEKVLTADDKQSSKALLKLADGKMIETVLIAPKPGTWSACISCQVGCPMNCRFCATGKLGLQRNLTAEEITDQILFWNSIEKTLRQPAEKFREVSFSYNGGGPVLEGISFRLEPGAGLGLLGRTGSGKSTLGRVIFRLYDVKSESIQVNNLDLRDIRLEAVRRNVSDRHPECAAVPGQHP